ncbi:MAG TPA: hypothetical protein V6D15_14550 [Oculatellaceae cyanobacterium]
MPNWYANLWIERIPPSNISLSFWKLTLIVERLVNRRLITGCIPVLSPKNPALGKGTLLGTRRLRSYKLKNQTEEFFFFSL